MNFEFLKNLPALSRIYRSSTDAEELVHTRPDHSLFASRKSAETLARYLYMAAHREEVQGLTFADILSDYTVKSFIKNKDVLDAFHYIRKSGNRAVHGNESETEEDALSVLQDLHYVAGESAKALGFIKNYPDFDSNIGVHPDAKYTEEDVNQKAELMYKEYIEQFYEQVERDSYIEPSAEELFEYVVEGSVDMHEFLEFSRKPKLTETTEYITNYLKNLIDLFVARNEYNENSSGHSLELDITLCSDGKSINLFKTPKVFAEALDNLDQATGFSVDIYCRGTLREFFDYTDNEGTEHINLMKKELLWDGSGMYDKLCALKRRERFVYKQAIEYFDSGKYAYRKIDNGKEYSTIERGSNHDYACNDLLSLCSHDILSEGNSVSPDNAV